MRPVTTFVAVGASYTFDPTADGVAGIYAMRVLERGVDPRALCAEARADRLGTDHAALDPIVDAPRSVIFGRGTRAHRRLARRTQPAPPERRRETVTERSTVNVRETVKRPLFGRWSRRLATAGFAALLLLPLGGRVASADDAPLQARYIVQEGDTLDGVAAEFGVDPDAILAASDLQNPPYLTPSEIVVIPATGESPEAAMENSAQRVGTSPFVVGAHEVSPGETVADIASASGLDAWTLAAFNGLSDIDAIDPGQRLRIPLTDRVESPVEASVAPAETGELIGENPVDLSVGGGDGSADQPARWPVFAADVPAYLQAYSLSCEYAAAYIATSGFGYGVPESAFLERIGQSVNPHWGYRGDINGAWGGSDDYGIYPEALVPTLNEFGYVGDVFYSGGDASALTARLDAGMPVLTWLGYFGDTAWQADDDGSYLVAPGMHVVVAYGYDDGGVYVSNPGRGDYGYYSWGDFLAMWNVLGGMSLGVAPM
jgi:LysM repeat protein/uncharacterized protein YvpB